MKKKKGPFQNQNDKKEIQTNKGYKNHDIDIDIYQII